ncbi:hypothetical protein [Streptomyces syringium]|uniref:hypothetical protein n=1 Tax=Streptomyces syringium TaxID=76729 RepID=UPI0033CA8746
MRELSRQAFPELVSILDGRPIPVEATGVQHRREADSAHALALRRGRAERAARQGGAPARQIRGAASAPEVGRTA